MHKYIILAFSLYAPLYCMESLITKESPYCFENLTVLEYDGYENHAVFIAKTAALVHSHTTHKEESPDYSHSKEHPFIKNLFFRKPQHNTYDLVTVYNPCMLNEKNISIHLRNIYDYLGPSGKFCGFIRTQTNHYSIAEKAFFTTYSHIQQEALHHSQKTMCFETLPPLMNPPSCHLTDDKLKEIIWANDYHIISYKNKTYETVIQNKCEYKKSLKLAFINNIRHCNLSKERIKELKKQFIKLVMKQSKKDSLSQLIESWNFTKITLCKAKNPRPPVFINNSLLSTEWTTKNYEK